MYSSCETREQSFVEAEGQVYWHVIWTSLTERVIKYSLLFKLESNKIGGVYLSFYGFFFYDLRQKLQVLEY